MEKILIVGLWESQLYLLSCFIKTEKENLYILTEIYSHIAVYNNILCISRCLFVEMEEGYLKKNIL